jgi:glycosyltransferase involved in cell wall biosynthesis
MGGVVNSVTRLSDHLVERGHEVVILTTDYYVREIPKINPLIDLVVHKNVFSKFNFYIAPQMYFWLQKNINNFDIIQIHDFRTYQNILVSYWANKLGKPFVLVPHGTLRLSDRYHGIKRAYDILFGNQILRRAKSIFAVCPPEVDEISEKLPENDKIRLVYTGVDSEDFESRPKKGSFRKQWNILPETKIVMSMGRLHPIKGFDILVRSFAKVVKKNENVYLVIVGPDEGEKNNLIKLTEELGIGDLVIFPGPIYGRGRLDVFEDADLFVLNSLFEAFGTVAFEAMLCGLPVIMSNRAGMSSFIRDHDAGHIVPYGDVDKLASQIQYLLSTDVEAIRLAAAGERLVRENFSWEIIINDYERYFYEILEEK